MSISVSSQKLLDFHNQGYLFHGSTNPDIKILEPRTAVDTDETNIFNNDTAVFASTSPAASAIFACMSRDNIPGSLKDGTWIVGQGPGGEIQADIPIQWQPYLSQNTGYVYVLSSDSFSGRLDTGWQVKSTQPITPITKIKVVFADFEQLGGKIQWTEETS
jgi:hypothetical protein